MNEGSLNHDKAPRRTVPHLLWHFLRTYPRRTATAIALLSLAGLAEGISAISVLPILQVTLAGHGENGGRASQWIAWALSQIGLRSTLGPLLLLIVAGIMVKATFTLIAMKQVGFAVSQLMTDLRRRLISTLMRARWSYFVATPLGVFANALGAETIRAGISYQLCARFASAAIQAAVYGIATVIVSWKAAVLAMLVGLFAAIAFRRLISAAHNHGGRHTELMRALATRTTDTLQGIKPIKAMGAEACALPLLDREIEELDDVQRQHIRSAELLRIAQEPILVVVLAGGIYGAVEFGAMPLTTLLVVAVLFYRLFNRFQAMQEIYQQVSAEASAYWSVFDLCKVTERDSERSEGAVVPQSVAAGIDMRNVSFYYGSSQILNDVTFAIAPGEFVTIVGPSGVGKTTLLDLMCGLLNPQTGRIAVNGRDLDEIDMQSWRARIGYVPQDVVLLHDTVYHNVCLGDETISVARAEQALRAAGVWDVVADLPEGIHSPIGERGGRLSGGQRQRISLARALARTPCLLLLDEITAALDERTEREVCTTLRELAGSMTVVAVSHQPAMANAADRRLLLQGGKVVPHHTILEAYSPAPSL